MKHLLVLLAAILVLSWAAPEDSAGILVLCVIPILGAHWVMEQYRRVPHLPDDDSVIRAKEREERWASYASAGTVTRNAIPAEMRWEIFRRDGFMCRYCGETDEPLELDHIIPVSQGGQDTHDNLVTACRTCNRNKGGRRPSEWRKN